MTNNSIEKFKELYQTIKILRNPNGCPWDSKQTSKSLIPYLLEETYDVIEAIENEINMQNIVQMTINEIKEYIYADGKIIENTFEKKFQV